MTDTMVAFARTCDEIASNFSALKALAEPFEAAVSLCSDSLCGGGKLLLCGNGGSAADAQHFAAELTGRFERDRRGLAAIALTTDTSALKPVPCSGGLVASDKIISLPACVRAVSRLRAEGKRIGFTNGCFDCCHLGHVSSIREARALCDILVVGVNSDA